MPGWCRPALTDTWIPDDTIISKVATKETREKKHTMTIATKATQAVASRAARMREATDRKIMQATLQIATSRGIGAVTIEEVARRSGVAKTTIYRRYRNTGDLLRKIQIETSGTFEVDDIEPTRDDLHCLLERVAAAFNGEIGLKAVGLTLSSDNDYVKGLADQVIAPAEQRFGDYIRRGVEAGIFRHGLDVKFLFSTVLGSMLAYKALQKRQAGVCASAGAETDVKAGADIGAQVGAGARVEINEHPVRNVDSATWADHMASLLWPALAA